MDSAIGVEPTKLTADIRASCSKTSTADLSPFTTLKTPSGNPALRNSSAISRATLGSRSDGFRINVLPQAIAIGNIHIGTIAGKLNGVIPATTPNGCSSDQLSMPGPAFFENSPLSNSEMPQAYSTTSIPRPNSPLASSRTLPCSAVINAHRASACCSSNSLNLNKIFALF